MKAPFLVKPSVEYEESYRSYDQEIKIARDDTAMRRDFSEEESFVDFVERLRVQERGERLPEGWVPASIFWLIDEGEVVGTVSIRHRLTQDLKKIGGNIGYEIRPSKRKQGYGTKILELALQEAHELGIDEVLVTCDETNTGSKKIIEKNGGVFDSTYPVGKGKPNKLRYWITFS